MPGPDGISSLAYKNLGELGIDILFGAASDLVKPEATDILRDAYSDRARSGTHDFNLSLLCCLPKIVAPKLSYENIFRVIILQFMDAYDFDVRSVKKSCVHIVNKDNKLIPFETMNLFYRDDKINHLKKIQGSLDKGTIPSFK